VKEKDKIGKIKRSTESERINVCKLETNYATKIAGRAKYRYVMRGGKIFPGGGGIFEQTINPNSGKV
jgi:hypothetical protein